MIQAARHTLPPSSAPDCQASRRQDYSLSSLRDCRGVMAKKGLMRAGDLASSGPALAPLFLIAGQHRVIDAAGFVVADPAGCPNVTISRYVAGRPSHFAGGGYRPACRPWLERLVDSQSRRCYEPADFCQRPTGYQMQQMRAILGSGPAGGMPPGAGRD
jgi:hypothetical protein